MGRKRNTDINPAAHRRLKRWLFCIAALILIPVAAVAAYVLSRDAWHMLDEEKLSYEKLSVQVFDGNDQLYSALSGGEERLLTRIEDLPDHVKNAFIAAEDARFYDHPGVDVVRILGAAWSDLKAGAFVEGASTITQQLIKLTHLNSRKELSRKVDEAILAVQLERLYGKDQILEMYLNTVYFGAGYYGLETAARGYFGVSASELSLDQAALLAGVLKSPARFSPQRRPEASVGRRGVILHLMAEYGMISEAEADEASARPLRLKKDPVLERRGYYVDYALLESCRLLGVTMNRLLNDGYRIYTGMDREAETLSGGPVLPPGERGERPGGHLPHGRPHGLYLRPGGGPGRERGPGVQPGCAHPPPARVRHQAHPGLRSGSRSRVHGGGHAAGRKLHLRGLRPLRRQPPLSGLGHHAGSGDPVLEHPGGGAVQ